MKLFSPTQSKTAFSEKRDADIAQVAYLTVTLKKLQDRINTETALFDEKMKEQRKLYTEAKERLQSEIRALEGKIREGEERLLQLLLPIDGLKEQAEEALKNAQEKAKSILQREEEVTELQEHLKDKIDALTEREIRVSENEVKIESRLKGIEEESKMISKRHEELNKEVIAFNEYKKEKEKFLSELESATLIKAEMNEKYLQSRKEELDTLEKEYRSSRR